MDKFARFKFQPCIPLGEDGRCITASKKHINLSRKAATEGENPARTYSAGD